VWEAASTLTAPPLHRLVAILRLWLLHHHWDFEADPTLLPHVHTLIAQLAAANANFEHDLLLCALEARGCVCLFKAVRVDAAAGTLSGALCTAGLRRRGTSAACQRKKLAICRLAIWTP
jgi:hypothetical protein